MYSVSRVSNFHFHFHFHFHFIFYSQSPLFAEQSVVLQS